MTDQQTDTERETGWQAGRQAVRQADGDRWRYRQETHLARVCTADKASQSRIQRGLYLQINDSPVVARLKLDSRGAEQRNTKRGKSLAAIDRGCANSRAH